MIDRYSVEFCVHDILMAIKGGAILGNASLPFYTDVKFTLVENGSGVEFVVPLTVEAPKNSEAQE